jgi:hypothetical protein
MRYLFIQYLFYIIKQAYFAGVYFSSFSGTDNAAEDSDKTLNIFSVASGHLYERLLR